MRSRAFSLESSGGALTSLLTKGVLTKGKVIKAISEKEGAGFFLGRQAKGPIPPRLGREELIHR
jgi:hypothetical protein